MHTDSFQWQRYTSNDFPSHVHSLTTILGSVIDSDHQVPFGSWTIGFGEQKPSASYNCPQDSGCYIMVTNLKCANPSTSNTSCDLKLTKAGSYSLIIPERQETFRMYCLFDVSLEPRIEDEQAKTAISREQ